MVLVWHVWQSDGAYVKLAGPLSLRGSSLESRGRGSCDQATKAADDAGGMLVA